MLFPRLMATKCDSGVAQVLRGTPNFQIGKKFQLEECKRIHKQGGNKKGKMNRGHSVGCERWGFPNEKKVGRLQARGGPRRRGGYEGGSMSGSC